MIKPSPPQKTRSSSDIQILKPPSTPLSKVPSAGNSSDTPMSARKLTQSADSNPQSTSSITGAKSQTQNSQGAAGDNTPSTPRSARQPPPLDPASYKTQLKEKGHLFIVCGDLRKVACDAWLVPCSNRFQFDSRWLPTSEKFPSDLAGELTRKPLFEPPDDPHLSNYKAPSVLKVVPWPLQTFSQPYMVNVTGIKTPTSDQSNLDLSSTMEAVGEFLKCAASDFKDVAPRRKRVKHLFCMPLVGTGHGGARNVMGLVIKELLPVVFRFVNHNNFDVALVTNEPTAYAALQSERKRWEESAWLALEPPLRVQSRKLARFASHDQLVLFLGAGVSMSAGLPSWDQLLKQLASEAKMSDMEVQALKDLSYLDQARIIERRLGGSKELTSAIVEKLKSPYYSLAHALLASLPVKEVVTTNYDQLFEAASLATQRSISVLPYEPNLAACDRWMLKLHGCISHPNDIVLTREDYLRYENQRAALIGIVQSLLITKHMLFVGFGLQDDNFHKVVDSVRKAIHRAAARKQTPMTPSPVHHPHNHHHGHHGHQHDATSASNSTTTSPAVSANNASASVNSSSNTPSSAPSAPTATSSNTAAVNTSTGTTTAATGTTTTTTFSATTTGGFGTALFLLHNELMQELWNSELELVAMDKAESTNANMGDLFAAAARKLEIFLDHLASETSSNVPHLLDPKFEGLLDKDELLLKQYILDIINSAPKDVKKLAAWVKLKALVLKNFSSTDLE